MSSTPGIRAGTSTDGSTGPRALHRPPPGRRSVGVVEGPEQHGRIDPRLRTDQRELGRIQQPVPGVQPVDQRRQPHRIHRPRRQRLHEGIVDREVTHHLRFEHVFEYIWCPPTGHGAVQQPVHNRPPRTACSQSSLDARVIHPRGANMITTTPSRQIPAPTKSHRSGWKASTTTPHASDPATNTPPYAARTRPK